MKRIIICLFLISIGNLYLSSQDLQIETGVGIVQNYLSEILPSEISKQGFIDYVFFHPDSYWLPENDQKIYVVCEEYSVINYEKKIMNINIMEPVDEEIVVIDILFPTIGFISGGKLYPQKSNFIRTYYLSRSTGELMILDMTRAMDYIATLPKTINWLKERIKYNDYYQSALIDLLEIRERGE